MPESNENLVPYKIGIIGGIFILLGTSIPLLLSFFLQPKQPTWTSAEVFVEHFHVIQGIPIYFGFLLIGGSLLVIGSIYLLSSKAAYPFIGVIFSVIGGAIIFLNYIIQTTYIPALVSGYQGGNNMLIVASTMANPTSLAWALEMWGYGFLGLGTWLCASYFSNKGIEHTAKLLFIANGVLSIIGTIWTAVDLGWVLTTPGLISFVLWNILYIALAIVTIIIFNRKRKELKATAYA
jgi:hypothetical protein